MRLASLSGIVSKLGARAGSRIHRVRSRRRFSGLESLEARLALDATGPGTSDGGGTGTTDPSFLALLVSTTVDEVDGDHSAGDLSLREAVILANAHVGPVDIELPAGVYRLTIPRTSLDANAPNDAASGDLLISKQFGPVRIFGQTAATTIIDANDLDRALTVGQGATTLYGLTLRGGNATSFGTDAHGAQYAAGNGGAIFVGGSLRLENSVVEGNYAPGLGGGIYVEESAALTMIDTIVRANWATHGGGAWLEEDANVVIQGSEFAHNTAPEAGGGLYLREPVLDITGSSIHDNYAGVSGGGIHVDRAFLTIESTDIGDNYAGLQGGGIYLASDFPVEIAQSTLSTNTTGDGGQGGGLFVYYADSLTITDTDINANRAGVTSGSGGGIYKIATLPNPVVVDFTITGGTIVDNFAPDDGGGVALGENVVAAITGTTFGGNVAGRYGGGVSVGRFATLSMHDSTFRENNAERGGGVYLEDDAQAEIHGGLFEANSATDRGGGVWVGEDSALVLVDATLRANTAAGGGGMHVDEDGRLDATHVRFEANVAASVGGGLSSWDGPRLTFLNSQFLDNHAGDYGGGLAVYDGSATFDAVEIRGNTAGQRGGGVFLDDDGLDATFVDSVIAENSVGENGQGGGVYSYSAVVTLNDVTVTDNSTGEGGSGGGLYFDGRGTDENTSTIVASTIQGNSASTGGGITVAGADGIGDGGVAIAGGLTLAISNTAITGNSASVAGGGLLTTNLTTELPPAPSITLDNVQLVGNTAAFGAGLCNGNNQSLALTNSLIAGNTATQQGGGAINDGGYLRLDNSDVRGNRVLATIVAEDVKADGGGILNQAIAAPATLVLASSRVVGNAVIVESLDEAIARGGGIANIENGLANGVSAPPLASLYVDQSTIAENSVMAGLLTGVTPLLNSKISAIGAGVYSHAGAGDVAVTILRSTIQGNIAQAALGRGEFRATAFGGGIYFEGLNESSLTIVDSTIAANVALSNGVDRAAAKGGGIYFDVDDFVGEMNARLIVRGSTISGNVARGASGVDDQVEGGGIAINHRGGDVEIATSTITENQVIANAPAGPSAFGGGISYRGFLDETGPILFYGSIIARNTSPQSPDIFATSVGAGVLSLGYNLIGNGDGATGFAAPGDQVGTSAAPINPRLGTLADNGGPTRTHALLPGSPAIDAGDPAFDPNVFTPPLSTDQRGQPRVLDGNGDGTARIDIGSFEYSAAFLFGDLNGDGVVGLGDVMVLRRNLGATNASLAQGDLTGDGLVDRADIGALVSHFGSSMSSVTTAPAPAAVVARAAARADAGRVADGAIADARPAVREARRRALTPDSVDRALSGPIGETLDAGESSTATKLRARRRGR